MFDPRYKSQSERIHQIEKWDREHGALILGYDMFRRMAEDVTYDDDDLSDEQVELKNMLIHPGPDLLICDEGHLLKNEKTSISDSLSVVRTMRKIVLTGTPLQNNLDEYFCMVNVVRPHLLGTRLEFTNRFANPIMNGQYTNSTRQDIKTMKRRSHVLHKLLDGVFHRADKSVLEPFLSPKMEFVVYIRLTELQVKLYKVLIFSFQIS